VCYGILYLCYHFYGEIKFIYIYIFLDRPILQTAVALGVLVMIMLNNLSLHLRLMSSVPLSLLPFCAIATFVDGTTIY